MTMLMTCVAFGETTCGIQNIGNLGVIFGNNLSWGVHNKIDMTHKISF